MNGILFIQEKKTRKIVFLKGARRPCRQLFLFLPVALLVKTITRPYTIYSETSNFKGLLKKKKKFHFSLFFFISAFFYSLRRI